MPLIAALPQNLDEENASDYERTRTSSQAGTAGGMLRKSKPPRIVEQD